MAFLFLESSNALAQKEPTLNRILFIFDASQSMLGRWQSGRKIDIAKNLLSNMVDSLKDIDNLELGFRVYGHKSGFPQDCEDTHLEVNFLPADLASNLIKKISEDQSKFKKGKIIPELNALTGLKKISKDQSKFKKGKN